MRRLCRLRRGYAASPGCAALPGLPHAVPSLLACEPSPTLACFTSPTATLPLQSSLHLPQGHPLAHRATSPTHSVQISKLCFVFLVFLPRASWARGKRRNGGNPNAQGAFLVASPFRRRAAYGNRTRLLGLGSRCTTDVLMPPIVGITTFLTACKISKNNAHTQAKRAFF